MGVAFAVPANTVETVVEQLKSEGKVTRGYLGVQIQPLNKELVDSLGLRGPRRARSWRAPRTAPRPRRPA